MERTARIELASSRRHRAALPLSYVRILVSRDGIEPPQPRRGVYSALGSPMPSLPMIGCGGRNRTDFMRLMRPQGDRCPSPQFAGPSSLKLRRASRFASKILRSAQREAGWRKVKESNPRGVLLGLVFKTSCAPPRATFQVWLGRPDLNRESRVWNPMVCRLAYAPIDFWCMW